MLKLTPKGCIGSVYQMLSLLIFLLLSSVNCQVLNPTPQDFQTLTNVNTPLTFKLQSNTIIPDNDELTWSLFVPDSKIIANVQVNINGLYHQWASDLSIKLVHNNNEAVLFSNTLGSRTFGIPDIPILPADSDNPIIFPSTNFNSVSGIGFDYEFTDLTLTNNIALGKTTTQSSTLYGGISSRAVDGVTNGYYSDGSVTHTNGYDPIDPQPWWGVDLGSNQNIGSIKVWNRVQEYKVDTIQKVTSSAVSSISGSFRLQVTYGTMQTITGNINYNAVAEIKDESVNCILGSCIGDSMQSKLQSLENVGVVSVSRSSPDAYGGYSWTITFIGDPGSVPILTWIDPGSLNGQRALIDIAIVIPGSSEFSTTNYETDVHEVTKRLMFGWVMVFAEGTVIPSDLTSALHVAVWSQKITSVSVENNFNMPFGLNVIGRHVRIQLETSLYLTLAEVQVFSSPESLMKWYRGGSPIIGGSYQSDNSLVQAFQGSSSVGEWLLVIDDSMASQIVNLDSSLPSQLIHGTGGLDDWSLTITAVDGTITTYLTDISASVRTLPKFGSLYWYDSNQINSIGLPFAVAVGMQRDLSNCYNNCNNQYGVGNNLSTSEQGAVASDNRVVGSRLVVYVPNDGYVGSDSLSFSISDGVSESSNTGTVTINIRKCRLLDCTF